MRGVNTNCSKIRQFFFIDAAPASSRFRPEETR
jgi:hypothetical protein